MARRELREDQWERLFAALVDDPDFEFHDGCHHRPRTPAQRTRKRGLMRRKPLVVREEDSPPKCMRFVTRWAIRCGSF